MSSIHPFWGRVGACSEQSSPQTTTLYLLAHRLLQRFFITGLCQRKIANKPNTGEVFYLECFVDGHPINIPMAIITLLLEGRKGMRPKSPIHGGRLVTLLAKHFGLSNAGMVSRPIHYL